MRGYGISPAFSFLAEMRRRDNLKSNIYCQLVDGLLRRQFKAFSGFFFFADWLSTTLVEEVLFFFAIALSRNFTWNPELVLYICYFGIECL